MDDDRDQHPDRAGRPGTPGTPGADEQPQDPLLAVRARLEEVDDLPLAERGAVFDAAHRVVVDELRALELG